MMESPADKLIQALRMHIPVHAMGVAMGSTSPTCLIEVEDPTHIKYSDVRMHSSLLKAVLAAYPEELPRPRQVMAAFAALDQEAGLAFSRGRTKAQCQSWASGESSVLLALLSYVRRLWRKTGKSSRCLLIQEIKDLLRSRPREQRLRRQGAMQLSKSSDSERSSDCDSDDEDPEAAAATELAEQACDSADLELPAALPPVHAAPQTLQPTNPGTPVVPVAPAADSTPATPGVAHGELEMVIRVAEARLAAQRAHAAVLARVGNARLALQRANALAEQARQAWLNANIVTIESDEELLP